MLLKMAREFLLKSDKKEGRLPAAFRISVMLQLAAFSVHDLAEQLPGLALEALQL